MHEKRKTSTLELTVTCGLMLWPLGGCSGDMRATEADGANVGPSAETEQPGTETGDSSTGSAGMEPASSPW